MANNCCSKRRKKQEACGAAGHVHNEVFAEVDGVAFGIIFELLEVPVLGDRTDSSHDLDNG